MRLWSATSISALRTQVTLLALPLTAIVVLHASASEVATLDGDNRPVSRARRGRGVAGPHEAAAGEVDRPKIYTVHHELIEITADRSPSTLPTTVIKGRGRRPSGLRLGRYTLLTDRYLWRDREWLHVIGPAPWLSHPSPDTS
jgi:hypothetical protein